MQIRPAGSDDAVAIAYIYNYYIATSHATFEIEPIDEAEMQRRIGVCLAGDHPFVVCAGEGGELLGYAYGHEHRPRKAYENSIEISVYVRPGQDGRGVGNALYEKLFEEIGKRGFHAVIAGISLPNDASVRLHEKFGMTKVAHFREVGRKFDRWIDVGYWELILDQPGVRLHNTDLSDRPPL